MPTRLTFMIVAFAATVVVAQTAPYREVDRWTPRVDVIDVVDLDGDGDDDLLLAGRRTALNDGTGAFVQTSAPDCGGTASGPAVFAQPFDLAFNAAVCKDLNGDGLVDLLAAGAAGFVNLRLGVAGGGFLGCVGSGIPFSLGSTAAGPNVARSLAVGDVDGDGDQDVLVGCAGGAPTGPPVAPVLLLNVSVSAGFYVAASAAWGLGTQAQYVVDLTDLDGDGDPDLVGVGGPSATPCVVRQNLGGSFGPPIHPPGGGLVPLPADPQGRHPKPICADFDGDGLREILLRASPAGPVVLLAQTAPFVFAVGATATPTPLDVATPVGASAADFDGDGQLEIALAAAGGVSFQTWNGVAFAPAGPPIPASAYGAAPSDVDGDGDVDLVLAEAGYLAGTSGGAFEYPVRVAFNRGSGAFDVPEGTVDLVRAPSAFDAADFDGDGDLDLAGYRARSPDGSTGGPTIALNLGDGTFGPWSDPPCAGCPGYGFAMPSALFGAQQSAPFAPEVAAADFDLDGDGDLVVIGVGVPAGDFWIRNDGAAGFVAAPLPPPPPNSTAGYATIAVDLDLDGGLDLVTTGLYASAFVRYATPAGFGAAVPLPVAPYVADVAAGDFDGDGDPDLVFVTAGAMIVVQNRIPQGQGLVAGGMFAAPLLPFLTRVYATDFNLDGLADVVANTGWGWLATGPLIFGIAGYVTTASGVSVAALADFDADGREDLLDAGGRFFRNDFPFGFQLVATSTEYGPTFPVARVADFDRDGDDDLLLPGPRILAATARQLSTLRPAALGGATSFAIAGPALGSWLVAGNFVGVWPTYVPAAAATPFGLLQLDPSSAVVFGLGALDAAGKATLSGVVPASVPGLAGTSFLLQAAVADAQGPRLTGSRLMTMFDY